MVSYLVLSHSGHYDGRVVHDDRSTSNGPTSSLVFSGQRASSNHWTGGGDLGHQVVVPFTVDLHVGRGAQY